MKEDDGASTGRKLIYEELTEQITYMKLLNKPVGFIINFNVPVLRAGGIVRKVFDSASPRLGGESQDGSQKNE
jgi:hypothetical protein